MKWNRIVAPMLTFAVLACTSTPYQPFDLGRGYTDERMGTDRYWVLFQGDHFSTYDAVALAWLYRCAEVTIAAGKSHFVELPSYVQSSPDSRGSAATMWFPIVLGKHGGTYYVATPLRRAEVKVRSGTIRVLDGPTPDDAEGTVYDAAQLLRELSPQVRGQP